MIYLNEIAIAVEANSREIEATCRTLSSDPNEVR